MLKKTLLSLAITATVVGIAGCNVSSTDKYDNKIDSTPVVSGQPGSGFKAKTAPIFSPANSQIPLATDFVFADAATYDGTANTKDTTPPVTTALNKLDGFSTVAPHYIEFNAELDASTVVAGKTVFLAKLNPLDGEALKVDEANPFNSTSPITHADYEARAIDMNGTPAIQILLKKPLAAKTKYLVIITNGVKDRSGEAIVPSAEFDLVAGSLQLPSAALEPVRGAVQGWQKLANGFLASGSALVAAKEGSSILSYTFTTGGTTDVLHAMAAPGTFMAAQLPTIAHAEGAITSSVIKKEMANGKTQEQATAIATGTLDYIASQVAAGGGASGLTRDQVKAHAQLGPAYYATLIKTVADGSGAGLDSKVDKPKSRTYNPIATGVNAPVAVPYDTFLDSMIKAKIKAAVLKANPNASDTDIANAIAAQNPSVATQVAALSSQGSIYQGGLTIPNYLPDTEAGKADSAFGSWVANEDAATALGKTVPKDANGSTNVTYRFPFAKKLGDKTIPVMVTLPADAGQCAKANFPDGYPVAIYQHGITVDRTAGVLVGNALAKACVAMVAIDHAMHGVSPQTATGLAFSTEQVDSKVVLSNSATYAYSPFSAVRAATLAASPTSWMKDLHERHNNVGKNAAQQNVAMVFKGAKDADGNAITANSVGASGDLYINLQDFARTRDGIRQTVLDMLNLNASIDNMDVDANGTADDLDPAKVYFIGHSLGGIVGSTFVAVNNDEAVQTYSGKSATNPTGLPKIQAAILGNPGGGVVKLLENSPSIGGAKILPGLQAANPTLVQGSANLEKFFGVMQAMVDSGDPINFTGAGMKATPTLVYEAVGGVDGAKPDLVVPNNALNATVATAKSYLAGTDALVTALGITTKVNSATSGESIVGNKEYFPEMNNGSTVRAVVRMGAGDHSTFSNAEPQAAFVEIFQQVGSFFNGVPGFGTTGKGFVIEKKTVLEQAQ